MPHGLCSQDAVFAPLFRVPTTPSRCDLVGHVFLGGALLKYVPIVLSRFAWLTLLKVCIPTSD